MSGEPGELGYKGDKVVLYFRRTSFYIRVSVVLEEGEWFI